MVNTRTFLIIAIGLTLTGCSIHTGSSQGYQGFTSACSASFVNDYERVRRIAAYGFLKSDLENGISLANQFKTKYYGVRCRAEMTTPGELDKSETVIDANDRMDTFIKVLRNKLETARFRNTVL